MKKNYEIPTIDVIEINDNDILTESTNKDVEWPWGE